MQKCACILALFVFATVVLCTCNSTRYAYNLAQHYKQIQNDTGNYKLLLRNWDKKNRTVLEIITCEYCDGKYILLFDTLLYNKKTKTYFNNLSAVRYLVIDNELKTRLIAEFNDISTPLITTKIPSFTFTYPFKVDSTHQFKLKFILKANWYYGQTKRFENDSITKNHAQFFPILLETSIETKGQKHLISGKQFEKIFIPREDILF